MSQLSDAEILELNALCSALVDHTLDAPGRARLSELLAASDEARRFYVRTMALSASLHDYAGELQCDDPVERPKVVKFPAWRWVVGPLAAAAAVVAAFWLGGAPAMRRGDTSAAVNTDDENFVATLSATNDCRWGRSGPALGEELHQGQQLELTSGLAEVTFNSGAQVVMEGPATLELTSAWEAVLRRGSLRASVPPEAIGFRVSNPDVEVTDLGTEFSMVTSDGGGTEVFVLKGAVEANAGGQAQPITLREQQARRFHHSSMSEVRDREQKLKRWAGKSKFQQFTSSPDYVHWSFDETEGTALRAELIGFQKDGENRDGRILLPAGIANLHVPGRRAQALSLDGRAVAQAHLPAAGAMGTTIAFWVRVPDDSALTEAGPMIAFENSPTQISWNRDPTQGALGALRTETERQQLIGATSLRDGRWHHLAVVLGPGGRARQYVDGRLESAATKRPKMRRSERPEHKLATANATATLEIGGRLSRKGEPGESFRGLMDELFVASRALTPPEIRQLLRDNRPAPARATVADAGGTL